MDSMNSFEFSESIGFDEQRKICSNFSSIVFALLDDRKIFLKSVFLASIVGGFFLVIFVFFLSMKSRWKNKEKENSFRIRFQQLQQTIDQLEFERATSERQKLKLSNELKETKLSALNEKNENLQTIEQIENRVKTVELENRSMETTLKCRDEQIEKQNQILQQLNDEILDLQKNVETQKRTIERLQSNQFSVERVEKDQQTIRQLQSQLDQQKEENRNQIESIRSLERKLNQINLEQHHWISKIQQFRLNNDEFKTIFSETFFDEQIEKSNDYFNDLQNQLEKKTSRIIELNDLLKNEQNRNRELETKMKIIIELRERDTQFQLRQLGEADFQGRRAKNQSERLEILQNEILTLQEKNRELEKLNHDEQIRSGDQSRKFEHEIHEKWMEIKRLTRELEISKKESEGLRQQISKFSKLDRSLTGKKSAELDSTPSSPRLENFRPIDLPEKNSTTMSPIESFLQHPAVLMPNVVPFFPRPLLIRPRFPIAVLSPQTSRNLSFEQQEKV